MRNLVSKFKLTVIQQPASLVRAVQPNQLHSQCEAYLDLHPSLQAQPLQTACPMLQKSKGFVQNRTSDEHRGGAAWHSKQYYLYCTLLRMPVCLPA